MKYLKMLGLAVIAASAFMAFVGAGTASATICTTDVNGGICPTGWQVDKLELSQVGSGVLETTPGSTLITCTGADITVNSATAGATRAPVSTLDFTECNTTPKVLANGEIEVNSKDEVRSIGGKITATLFGVSCEYGTGEGTTLGNLTTGHEPHVDVNAVISKVGGGFLCPASTRWTTTFVVTNHTELYGASGVS